MERFQPLQLAAKQCTHQSSETKKFAELTPVHLVPAPEQHESAYLLPENAVDGGVVFGI